MFSPLFWPSIYYDLFPFGDAVYNLERPTAMPYREWSAYIISREELQYGGIADAIDPSLPYDPQDHKTQNFRAQPGPSRWRLDRDFLCTVYCLGKRIDIIYGVKTHIARRNFGACVNAICKLQVQDLVDTIACIQKEGSVRKAIHDPKIPAVVRTCLESLKISTANVVGTDGHRVHLRHVLTNYRNYFGPNVIFIIPNLADTRNPLMLLTYQGVDSAIDLTLSTPEMLSLREMKKILADDPVGQTIFYREMMTLFFEILLGVTLTSSQKAIAPDGIASNPNGGILGRIQACCGPQEPQNRGSLHPHTSVFLLDNDYQRLLLTFQEHANNPEILNSAARQWVQATINKVISIQFDDISETAPFFAVGQGRSLINYFHEHRKNTTTSLQQPTNLPSTTNYPQPKDNNLPCKCEGNCQNQHDQTGVPCTKFLTIIPSLPQKPDNNTCIMFLDTHCIDCAYGIKKQLFPTHVQTCEICTPHNDATQQKTQNNLHQKKLDTNTTPNKQTNTPLHYNNSHDNNNHIPQPPNNFTNNNNTISTTNDEIQNQNLQPSPKKTSLIMRNQTNKSPATATENVKTHTIKTTLHAQKT